MEPNLSIDVFHLFASIKSSSLNPLILFETAVHFETPIYLSFKYNVSENAEMSFW